MAGISYAKGRICYTVPNKDGKHLQTNMRNRPRSIYQYSNMAPRLSGQTSIFGVVFFVFESLLGIGRQKKLKKFTILTWKPRSHGRILIYRTWPIVTVTITEGWAFAMQNTSKECSIALYLLGIKINRYLIMSKFRYCHSVLKNLGSFSKPRQRRQRELHQTKGLMCKTIAVHVRFETLYISLPPLQNNNVKWPSFMHFGEREPQWLIFVSSLGIERCGCIFSLSKFLDR